MCNRLVSFFRRVVAPSVQEGPCRGPFHVWVSYGDTEHLCSACGATQEFRVTAYRAPSPASLAELRMRHPIGGGYDSPPDSPARVAASEDNGRTWTEFYGGQTVEVARSLAREKTAEDPRLIRQVELTATFEDGQCALAIEEYWNGCMQRGWLA